MTKLEDVLLKIFNQKVEIEYINGDENKFSACINGLQEDSKPDCKIIDSFVASDKNKYYLVKIDDYLMHIRVCKADQYSDYAEYCVITFSENSEERFLGRKNSSI